jgi:hypothetical protein
VLTVAVENDTEVPVSMESASGKKHVSKFPLGVQMLDYDTYIIISSNCT